MQYYPGQSPSGIDVVWLQSELRRIAEVLEQGDARLRLSITAFEPDRLSEGEVRIANGVTWDPGRGAGTYIRRSGEWQLIEAGFTQDTQSKAFFLSD